LREISHNYSHNLEISHNRRIINSQNTIGCEITKLDTLAKLFQAEVEPNVDKTIGQLIKVITPRRLKKLSRWITKSRHSKYSFALSGH